MGVNPTNKSISKYADGEKKTKKRIKQKKE